MTFCFGPASRKRIDTLDEGLQRVCDRAMSFQIMDFSITQARRSHPEQKAIYAQGRESLAEVNKLRGIAGLAPIKPSENVVVTKTMNSNHLPNEQGKGDALDAAPYPYDPKDRERAWMLQGILLAAAAVEGVKVRSGADFNGDKNFRNDSFVDLPHIERA